MNRRGLPMYIVYEGKQRPLKCNCGFRLKAVPADKQPWQIDKELEAQRTVTVLCMDHPELEGKIPVGLDMARCRVCGFFPWITVGGE